MEQDFVFGGRIDWSAMTWDIIRSGLPVPMIARKLRIRASTVMHWREAQREPRGSNVYYFISLWMNRTRKGFNDIPMV